MYWIVYPSLFHVHAAMMEECECECECLLFDWGIVHVLAMYWKLHKKNEKMKNESRVYFIIVEIFFIKMKMSSSKQLTTKR